MALLALLVLCTVASPARLHRDIQVNTSTTDSQDDPAIAMEADGDFAVAWEDQSGGPDEVITLRRFDAALTRGDPGRDRRRAGGGPQRSR